MRRIDLPVAPGRRSVRKLLTLADDVVYGVTVGSAGGLGYFRYDPKRDHVRVLGRLPDSRVEPRELADPDAGFTWDPSGTRGYSVSHTGKLRMHTMVRGRRTSKSLGQVAGARPFEVKPESAVVGYQRSQAVFFDDRGRVYTAGEEGRVFCYSPRSGKLRRLDAQLPALHSREPWASLDAAVVGPDGLAYGGSFDGYLFTLDLNTLAVVNLGKPLRQQRIRGLVFSGKRLHGFGGEEQGLTRSFVHDPATRGFKLGPDIQPERPIFDPVGDVTVDTNGTIYFGTTGRLGCLYQLNP